MIFPNLKLLLKMLGIIVLIIVVAVVATVYTELNLVYVGALIPLGLFAFVIYKFRKEGVVAILYFLGGGLIVGSILNYYLGLLSFLVYIISLILGVVLTAVAFLLVKIWNVKFFKKKDEYQKLKTKYGSSK